MTDKGVTIERSPSGLGIGGVFTPHLTGGGGSAWEQQQQQQQQQAQQQPQPSAIITKLTTTPPTRITRNTDSLDKARHRKSDEKNNVNSVCGCGGWARAGQLEHDLAELKVTHRTLLSGLHHQVETLKQKNRDLTFQLLMGPYADQVKQDIPFSPESDEAVSPKNEAPVRVEAGTISEVLPPNGPTAIIPATTNSHPQPQDPTPEALTNGDVVLRRPQPGRSVRGDPRLVRSLDLELLEEEAGNTRRLLEEERAKNKYLTTLVEDLKRQAREGPSETPGAAHANAVLGAPPQLPPPRPPPRPHPRTHPHAPPAPAATRTSPHHTRQGGQRDASPQSSQPERLLSSPLLMRRDPQTDREPRFPPLRGGNSRQPQQRYSISPTSRSVGDRSREREGGTTFPAIANASSHQQPEQQQQHQQQQKQQQFQQQQQPQQQHTRRGKHFGRGRTRNRQHQGQQSAEQQQQQQQPDRPQQPQRQQRDNRQGRDTNDTANDTRPRDQNHVQNSGSSSARGSGRPVLSRDGSSGRQGSARAQFSKREGSGGHQNERHQQAGGNSSQNGDSHGASGHDPEPRPETRTKGRGRGHRRGGRGRPRKDKHNHHPETTESEQ